MCHTNNVPQYPLLSHYCPITVHYLEVFRGRFPSQLLPLQCLQSTGNVIVHGGGSCIVEPVPVPTTVIVHIVRPHRGEAGEQRWQRRGATPELRVNGNPRSRHHPHRRLVLNSKNEQVKSLATPRAQRTFSYCTPVPYIYSSSMIIVSRPLLFA